MQSVFFTLWIIDVICVFVFVVYFSGFFTLKSQVELGKNDQRCFESDFKEKYKLLSEFEKREQQMTRLEPINNLDAHNAVKINLSNVYDIDSAKARMLAKAHALRIEQEYQAFAIEKAGKQKKLSNKGIGR